MTPVDQFLSLLCLLESVKGINQESRVLTGLCFLINLPFPWLFLRYLSIGAGVAFSAVLVDCSSGGVAVWEASSAVWFLGFKLKAALCQEMKSYLQSTSIGRY